MNSSATDVIVARSRNVDRLAAMLPWSVAAHVAVTALVAFAPHRPTQQAPQEVMFISFQGAPGPRTGMTQMSARNVQVADPNPAVKKAETAPAPAKKEMTLPDPRSKPQARPKDAPKEATSKAPSTGEKPQEGEAKAETRVRGQGFAGLSSGGGGGSSGVTVDAPNFCCPDYIETFKELIQQNWNRNKGLVGITTIKFTIQRSGKIDAVQLERSSGFSALDVEAERAVRIAQLPPLPTRYVNPTLTVHLEFEYTR